MKDSSIHQPQHAENWIKLDLRVLIAEDNPINVIVATCTLRKWGCECVVVGNGREVLEAAASGTFDLILMDVSMPEMDGLEATRKLRQMEAATGAHIPIIALTAHALHDDRERCLAAGMDDYVSKPLDPQVLAWKLRRWSRFRVSFDAAQRIAS